MNKIYLDLFKKITKAYKDDYIINVQIQHKEKHRFDYSSFVKISDVEIEDSYICVTFDDEGEMLIYEEDAVSYRERRGHINNNQFVIDVGNAIVIIDTENYSS